MAIKMERSRRISQPTQDGGSKFSWIHAEFEAGKVYELQIWGRSKGFMIDRVLLYQLSVVSKDVVETRSFPESPLLPTEGPVPSPTEPPVAGPTGQGSCGIPKFVDGWKSATKYPMPVAEAQGAMIGKDFVIISGFHEPDGGYDATTKENYALDGKKSRYRCCGR